MTDLRLVIDNQQAMERFEFIEHQSDKIVHTAARTAAEQTASEIEQKGRADIAAAGAFGPRWQRGFNVKVAGAPGGGIGVISTFRGEGWRRFQYGEVMQGRPLLWIGLSFSDAAGTPIKKYKGDLVRVERPGKDPLMVGMVDHLPKYVGKTEVVIPKKFHLIEIAQAAAAKMGERFMQLLQRLREHG